MYNEIVREHFFNPRNQGKIENADGIGKVGNQKCGDVMHLYIKVKDDLISDIKFETFGCGAAVATSSVITDLAKGKKINEAINLTNKDVLKVLKDLPPNKIHCSLLAEDGLKAAIVDYSNKHPMKIN